MERPNNSNPVEKTLETIRNTDINKLCAIPSNEVSVVGRYVSVRQEEF